MKFEIDEDVPLPPANGKAAHGPSLNKIDLEALAGLNSGLYDKPLDAAKALASKYKPKLWQYRSREERRDIIKSKKRKYILMLARLYPSSPS